MENTFKQIVLIQIVLLPVLVLLEIFFPVPEEISYLPYFSGAIANMSDGALIFSAIIGIGLLITNWVSCFLIYFASEKIKHNITYNKKYHDTSFWQKGSSKKS